MEFIEYFQSMWQLAEAGEPKGVWFWVAVYTLTTCLYSVYFQLRTRFWPSTRGQLAYADIKKLGGSEWARAEQEYVTNALYEYEVAGKRYQGSRVSPWIMVASGGARFILQRQLASVKRFGDGSVRVFYNPQKPEKSYLIVAGKTGILITLLISILPLVLFYTRFYG